jgi:leader peptidase (prepilin peptidase)/N-methyltransferase
VGSFLGVVIARLPANQSIITPRSRCDACKQPLRWYDNVPLLSYLILRGRCRACGASYGARSVLLELLTAWLFVALGAHWGATLALCAWLVFASGLIAITFLDIDYYWVPDVITYPLMVLALVATWLPVGPTLKGALWGLGPAALLWLVALAFHKITGKEGLGFGDIKLLAALGLMMGLPATLTALFLGSLQGAVAGSIILALGGHRQKPLPPLEDGAEPDPQGEEAWVPDPKAVPFGPFLVLGALEVLFFPDFFARLFARLVSGS